MALLDPVTVDHFKCYGVRVHRRVCQEDPTVRCSVDENCVAKGLSGGCNLGFQGRQVAVDDQFPQPARLMDVLKPSRLCIPVDKEGEGIQNPDAHLMCYTVKPAKGEPRHARLRRIHVNNQFGPEQLNTVREEELCVPSITTLP